MAQEDISPETETCPVCKNDRYLNPDLKLLVSPCYHRVCEACLTRLFAHGAAPCPVCGTLLRRSNFVVPTFEDLRVEKECRIRRRLQTIFNKREEDFDTIHAYNDYLEEVEEIVFNLMNNVDVSKINERLEEYRQQNQEQIARSAQRQQLETQQQQREQEEEERIRMEYEIKLLAEIEEERLTRQRQEEAFIEDLAHSERPQVMAARPTPLRVSKLKTQQQRLGATLPASPSPSSLSASLPITPRGGGGTRRTVVTPFDPFETVPEINLPLPPPSENLEMILTKGVTLDRTLLAAGGVIPGLMTNQVFLAAFTWGLFQQPQGQGQGRV